VSTEEEASRFFYNNFGKLKDTFIILAGKCGTLLGHQPYKIFPLHPFFAALPCEVTFVEKFNFFVIQSSRKKTTKLKLKV